MKEYSVKLNEEQFNMLHKAWSEAETILSGSTDIFHTIEKRGIAISALKSKDRLLRRLWKLLWFTENDVSIILELELLCLEVDAVCHKPFSSFDEFMAKSDDRLHDFNVYLYDNNLNEETWVCFLFYRLQHLKTLKVENVDSEIIF